MKNDDRVEVFFDVLLYQDQERRWRASSPAPYIDPSDYGFHEWADVVEAVLGHIMEEADGLVKAGFRVRVNFIPAILMEGDPYDQIVRAFQPLPPVSGKS